MDHQLVYIQLPVRGEDGLRPKTRRGFVPRRSFGVEVAGVDGDGEQGSEVFDLLRGGVVLRIYGSAEAHALHGAYACACATIHCGLVWLGYDLVTDVLDNGTQG